jgi:antitoxin component of MazEF toxin-antitoxin module
MKVGKIMKVGDSMAVVIPRSHLRRLGWLRGDLLTQEVVDSQLVLRNMRNPVVYPIHTRRENGDPNSGRT